MKRMSDRGFPKHFDGRRFYVRLDGIRFQPRLHDLSSTFAVHRIAAWYEQGLDAQELLPALGAYLGQLGLISMNRHLSLTPEHYRKHLATACRRRDSRKRGSKANPWRLNS
jgi:integrase/recombinase XerD